MTEPVMHCHELTKRFLAGDGVLAVDNVDLSIQKGEFVAITGASGSGKTTLLNLLGGIDRPTYGEIILDNRKYSRLSESGLARLRRTRLGFVFQFFNLLTDLSAEENVALPMRLVGLQPALIKQKSLGLLREVSVEARASHAPYELSGGEQQRVAIARALANDPLVVLADEPTGNLDSNNARAIIQLFKRLNRDKGQTFVVVSHDPHVAEVAHRVVTLVDGRVASIEGRSQP
ncbi:MAG: ABC transporter ATP-binding protein [Bacillota bacterium]|nr:ABC transporter ATP-binding protein [Bacillota bacterium]